MYATSLVCVWCGHKHEVSLIYRCEKCGGTLDVNYDYNRLFSSFSFNTVRNSHEHSIWKFRKLFPVQFDIRPVSLGEGDSPLIEADRLGKLIGHRPIYIKNETVNPTLSFKDRPLSVALTVAKQFQISGVITASTGNTGVAAAAYAAKAGIPCRIYVPRGTPQEKLVAMKIHGAHLAEVEGTFSDAYKIAEMESEKNKWFNLTSTFLNPYAIEGNKTIAYEIYLQFGGVPDWIVIPIGAGPLLVSCYKGFKELMQSGEISQLPRMVGVQAQNCAPIVQAYVNRWNRVKPWNNPDTIATGIADPLSSYPEDGTRTLRTIRESRGCAIAVDEESIINYRKLMADQEGIFAEPAAVTSVAAVKILKEKGWLKPDESIVCIVTGHGLKDLKSIGSKQEIP